MSDAAAIRQQLLQKMGELMGMAARIDARMSTALSGDSEEQALELENSEVLDRLDESTRAEILAIREAVRRIDAGVWMICADCGETIAPGRLKALPTTRLCVDCAGAA